MPNHVTNRMTVKGDLSTFRELLNFDPGDAPISFDKIIPMPPLLKDSSASSAATTGAKLLLQAHGNPFGPSFEPTFYPAELDRMRQETDMLTQPFHMVAKAYLKLHPEIEAEGKALMRNIAETGYPSWYEWSIANWGTKWDAYSGGIVNDDGDEIELTFDTAWSPPEPIFDKLKEMFPDLTFDICCFDEGWNFAGRTVDGQFITCEATAEDYEAVYGYPYEQEEEVE